ncbi:hypothetical protein [Vibrio alfacsensis]|uniref:hypothetical protein n=1 Tax=Vibrio alfacsensis TaxID=1074311 RepID=UPI001C7E3FFF|nr:hypothetical protein [Vibrio alfacsensis]
MRSQDLIRCPKPNVSGLQATFALQGGELCTYEFVVQDHYGQTASSLINVLSTSNEDPLLPAISKAMYAGGAAINIELENELAWPDGFELDLASVQVQGQDVNLGSALGADGNTIAYTPAPYAGWNQISFRIRSVSNPDDYMLGSVIIALSEQGNVAPVINQPHYDYNENTGNRVLDATRLLVDLENLEGLAIDDDNWYLVSATSPSSSVELFDDVSQTNKKFYFTAPTLGNHVVSYIVADTRGGYASGLMNIYVEPRQKEPNWVDVVIEGSGYKNTFIATERYSDIDSGIETEPYWDTSMKNTLALFTPEQAELYCQTKGQLPTVYEFERARQRVIAGTQTSGDFSKWPKQRAYIVKSDSGNGYKRYSLVDGGAKDYDGRPGYVSCVNQHDFTMDTLLHTVVANNLTYQVLRIQKSDPADEYLIEALAVNGSTIVPDIAIHQENVNELETVVTISGVQSGQFRLQVSNEMDPSQQLVSDMISIIGDAATTELTHSFSKDDPEAPYQQELTADDADVLNVNLDFNDINGNPIADKWYAYIANTQKMYTEKPLEQMITDQNGQLTIPMKASLSALAGEFEINRSFHIDVNGEPKRVLVRVIHPNRYVTVEMTPLETARLYTKSRFRVLNAVNEAIPATLQIVGGEIGSIIHIDGSDYVTEIPVPVEGVEVMVSMAINNNPAHIEFALDGSPSRPSIDLLGMTRSHITLTNTVEGLPIEPGAPSGPDDKQASRNFWREQMGDNDVLCVERTRSNTSLAQEFFPPIMGPDDVGKLAILIDRAKGGTRLYRIDGGYYSVNDTSAVAGSAVTYWDGRDWTRLNQNLHPMIRTCAEFFAL